MFLGVIMLTQKGISQKFQCINRWEFSKLSGVLAIGKGILCLGIDVFSISPVRPCLNPLITKMWANAKIHGAGIIHRTYGGPVWDIFFSLSTQ